jgi:hypothetical protein
MVTFDGSTTMETMGYDVLDTVASYTCTQPASSLWKMERLCKHGRQRYSALAHQIEYLKQKSRITARPIHLELSSKEV